MGQCVGDRLREKNASQIAPEDRNPISCEETIVSRRTLREMLINLVARWKIERSLLEREIKSAIETVPARIKTNCIRERE